MIINFYYKYIQINTVKTNNKTILRKDTIKKEYIV